MRERKESHMKAVTWQAKRRVSVDSVPDPTIQGAHRRDRPDHEHEHLRFRSAPLRDPDGLHGGR